MVTTSNTNDPLRVWPPYPGVLLRRDMRGVSVSQVQERLNELGATPRLATDGIFGPITEAAVVAFQRSRGLASDGIVGPLTWGALFSPAPQPLWPPYPGTAQRRGARGESVRQIQERLNQLGANPRLAVDGSFGPLTEAAVIAFQRSRGLVPDGVVGPLTWGALFPSAPTPPVPPQPPTPPPVPTRTIVLDPGHGGSDPGAVMGTRRESDDNLRLALAVQRLLQAQGQRVIMTRSTNVNVSLAERSAISNRNNADIFVSFHRNSAGPTANGVENFVFTTAPTGTVQNAFDVLDEIINAGVQRNRGVRRGNFAVIRNTNAPSMLLEMGFITNTRDNQLFDQNFDAYAAAIARGIMTALRTPRPPMPYTFYTVTASDNLQSIANRFGTTQAALMQLNKLSGPGLITGQVLKIPR